MELDDQIVGNSGSDELILSSSSIGYLNTIRKWTMFFSILGFVFVLLMFGMGFIVQALAGFNPAINAIPIGGLIVVYIILGLVYVPPIISLFKFSKNMKMAIENKNSLVLEEAFGNLKSHFKYIGVLTSIFVGIYGFIIVIAMVFGLFSKLL